MNQLDWWLLPRVSRRVVEREPKYRLPTKKVKISPLISFVWTCQTRGYIPDLPRRTNYYSFICQLSCRTCRGFIPLFCVLFWYFIFNWNDTLGLLLKSSINELLKIIICFPLAEILVLLWNPSLNDFTFGIIRLSLGITSVFSCLIRRLFYLIFYILSSKLYKIFRYLGEEISFLCIWEWYIFTTYSNTNFTSTPGSRGNWCERRKWVCHPGFPQETSKVTSKKSCDSWWLHLRF